MRPEHSAPGVIIHQPVELPATYPTPDHLSARLTGRWLMAVRLAWATMVLFTLGLFFVGLPETYAALHQPCAGAVCTSTSGQLTPADIHALQRLGFPLDAYAAYWLVIDAILALVYFMIGGFLAWRKSDDWLGLLVSAMLFATGAAGVLDELLYNPSIWRLPTSVWYPISSLLILSTFAVFPNGRFAPRWTRWILLVYPAQLVVFLLAFQRLHLPGWSLYHNPMNAIAWFGSLASLALAQVYRYFRASNQLERQQTKWIAFAFIVIFVGSFGSTAAENLLTIRGIGYSYITMTTLLAGLFLVLPVAFAMAVLRYRLWEIDVILSRTLVYGVLTTVVLAFYVVIVVSLSALFQTRGNLLISLVATGLVALVFQPLRDRVQRGVNRLLYGQRDEPYAVISRLSQRLGAALAPDAALAVVAETVAQALKLPYVAVALRGEAGLAPAAMYGAPQGATLTLPLVYQREALGELTLCPRQPDDLWTPADRLLLEELARQVGVAAHAARLTEDLRRSRERLVTTREEERRRLRRDLHDGLGPSLATISLKAEAARDLVYGRPDESAALLAEVIAQAQAAIVDIRRLVYALRPPALDDLGLVGAMRAQAAQYTAQDLHVLIDAPQQLPALPAAVEVAAYRIVQEALTNVIHHSHAHTCQLRVLLNERALDMEITDDGVGLAPHHTSGVGLLSMRERAEEVGGACVVESLAGGGVRVWASLPRV